MHRFALRASSLVALVALVALPLVTAASVAACSGASSPAGGGPGSSDAAAETQQGAEAGGPVDGAMEGATSQDSGKPHDAASDVVDSGPPFVMSPHPPWPLVPANAGIVLHSMKLVTVVTSGDPEAADLFAFGDALIASAWWTQISKEYGLGTPTTNVHVTGPAMTTNPTESGMLSYITSAVAGTPAAAADGDTMYMLYLPVGIVISDPRGLNTGCQYYGGYHTTYDKSGDAWGVAQHCPTTGTGLTDEQDVTITGSHEIVESASDPVPGNGYEMAPLDRQAPWSQSPWIQAVTGEIGDLCSGTQITEGLFVYQRIWSNAAAALEGDPCVPTYAPLPYVNASVPQGWYTITAGGSVQIPVTGFSDRPANPWIATASIWTSSGPTFQANLTSPTSITLQGTSYPTLNNGTSGTITVTAPAGAAAGSWAIVAIGSEPTSVGGDPYHLWVVGVYIP